MADDDAINEFAAEDDGEPRPADVAADLPLHALPDDYVDAASLVDDGFVPEVEDRYFRDMSGVPADEPPAAAGEMQAPAGEDSPTGEDYSYADDHSAYADDFYFDQSPAPIESSGRVQIVAALATVTMLGVMYVVFFQQRSARLISFPAPPSQTAVISEPTELASVRPPETDNEVPVVPNIPVPRPFEDPFGLTRGLSPSLPPPDDFAVRPPAAATLPESATPSATPPAAAAAASTPTPAATPSSAPAAVANVAPAPVVEPSAALPSPAATASAAPVPVTTTPVTTTPAATSPAPASPAVATRVAPTPTAVAPVPTAAAAAAPSAAAAAIDSNRNGIQSTLARYRKAFSSLNAGAVREVWPTVNERNLTRAFDRLEQQDVSFDRCQIEVANDRAEVTCNGTARYVPRVGSRTPRTDAREWRFNLVKVRDEWLIGAMDAR